VNPRLNRGVNGDGHDCWNTREDDPELTCDLELLLVLLVGCQHGGSTCQQVKESFSANAIHTVNFDDKVQCRSDDVVHKKHLALKEGHLDINSLQKTAESDKQLIESKKTRKIFDDKANNACWRERTWSLSDGQLLVSTTETETEPSLPSTQWFQTLPRC